MRIGIYGYGPSDSVRILRDGLLEADYEGTRVLLSNGESRFRGRAEDLVINYGSSNIDNVRRVTHNGSVINPAEAVGNASNKVRTFNILDNASVDQLESTTSSSIASNWLSEGHGVYARTVLTGHSGEGIIYVSSEQPEHLGNVEYSRTLPISPLYTKAEREERSEFRVHVAFGEVILVQQKRRRNGWRDNEDYSDIVRNHGNGWIYATSNIQLTEQSISTCLDAVDALGLDFGAVDLLTTGGIGYVVEVNTAPGLQGESSRQAYLDAFTKYIDRMILSNDESALHPEAWETNEVPPESITTTEINRSWGDWETGTTSAETIRNDLQEALVDENRGITEQAVRERLDAIFGTETGVQNVQLGTAQTVADPFAQMERAPTPERQENNLSSTAPPTTPESQGSLNGPGHYIADISEGVRTVICVLNTGEIYSAEHDLFLSSNDVSVISQIQL